MNDTSIYDLDDVRRISRRLETAMDGFHLGDVTEFAEAMVEYCGLVRYCNERLLAAHNRLREGNRSDAVETIEAEPNVLDCLQELDAVDARIPEWSDTLELSDIRKPERLLTELADELSQQYDVKHQLDEELRAHRLLAIGNGPIEQRVAVLRRMLRLDPGNKNWEKDLQDYERHCQSRLRAELQELDRGLRGEVSPQAAARVNFIAKQLADVSWQDSVDAAVVREAQAVQRKVRGLFVRAELARLGDTMLRCREGDETERAAPLLAQWGRLSDEIGLSETDPLVVNNEESIAWCQDVANQKAFEDALAGEVRQLSALLAKPIPATPGPSRQLHDALRMAQQRVRAAAAHSADSSAARQWIEASSVRMSDIDRRIRAVWWGGGAAALALLMAVGALGGLGWRASSTSSAREALVARIKRLQDDGRHLDVAEIIAAARPDVVRHSKVQQAIDDVEGEIKVSKENRQRIDDALAAAEETIATATSSVSAATAHKSLDGAAAAASKRAEVDLSGMDTALFRAGKAAESAASAVFLHGEGVDGRLGELRSLADRQKSLYKRWIAGVRDEQHARLVKRLGELGRSNDEKASASALEEVEADLKTLESFAGEEDKILRDLMLEAKSRYSQAAALTIVQRDLNRASPDGPEALLLALSKSAERLGDGRRGAQATEVAASRDSVSAALAWSAAARKWRPRIVGPRSDLRDWLLAIEAAAKSRPSGGEFAPENERLDELTQCLRQMAQNESDVSEEMQPLSDYLDSRIFAETVREIDYEGHPYYFQRPDTAGGRARRFTDEDNLDDGASVIISNVITKEMLAGNDRPARHAELASRLRKTIASVREGEVCLEEGLLAMLGDLLELPGVAGVPPDELLRARLLTDVLNLALSRHLLQGNKPLERFQEDLASNVGEGVAWVTRYDPLKKRLLEPEARGAAAKLLHKGAQRMKDIRDSFRARVESLGVRPSFCRNLEYIGWADDSGGALRCSLIPRNAVLAKGVGALYTVIKLPEDAFAWRLLECGELRNGIASVRTVDPAMFGRPLFLELRTAQK